VNPAGGAAGRVARALPGRAWTALAPGRINLLGEHTDYSEGFVLPAAVDRFCACAFEPAAGGRLHLHSLDLEDAFEVEPGALDTPAAVPAAFAALTRPGPQGWRRYALGVLIEVHRAGLAVPAGRLVISGDVPVGAGLSSSAALEAALYTALVTEGPPPLEAAALCRRAENLWAGVPCGLMDQFASFLGRSGHALLLDCRDLSWRPVPLPAGVRLTVVDSGVERKLADGAYARRRAELETALGILRRLAGPLTSLREVTPALFEELEDLLPDPLRRRVRHVVSSIARVPRGVTALALGDAAVFGRLMYDCHSSLARDYEVSRPELDGIVESSARVEGVLGARLTGAGFGGCCVVLHRTGCEAALAERVEADFLDRFGHRPVCHHLDTADGAHRISGEE
jgi:galactokinase